MKTFEAAGAKLVVTSSAFAGGLPAEWQPIPGTHYYFHPLNSLPGGGT
jgi:hypothetical protein